MRVALKLGYIGTNYYGFQIQPDVPTVSSKIFDALEELNIVENWRTAHFSFAGRTDRGVHAISQVISFDTKNPNISPRMVNSALPDDIFVIAIAYPYQKFNARRDAIWREYRYFLLDPDASLDIERMRIAASSFIGVHDFHNFAEKDKDEKTTVKHVLLIDIRRAGKFVVIDVRAHSFLRKMVRKMVTALKLVGEGEKPPEWISYLLHTPSRIFIPPAPAFGLLLRDVKYQGVEFEYDEYALKKLKEMLKQEILSHLTLSAVFEDMLDAVQNASPVVDLSSHPSHSSHSSHPSHPSHPSHISNEQEHNKRNKHDNKSTASNNKHNEHNERNNKHNKH